MTGVQTCALPILTTLRNSYFINEATGDYSAGGTLTGSDISRFSVEIHAKNRCIQGGVLLSQQGGNDACQYIAAPAFGHGGVAGTIEITTAFGGSKARMGTFEDDMDFFSGSKFPKQRKPPGIRGTFTVKTAQLPETGKTSRRDK